MSSRWKHFRSSQVLKQSKILGTRLHRYFSERHLARHLFRIISLDRHSFLIPPKLLLSQPLSILLRRLFLPSVQRAISILVPSNMVLALNEKSSHMLTVVSQYWSMINVSDHWLEFAILHSLSEHLFPVSLSVPAIVILSSSPHERGPSLYRAAVSMPEPKSSSHSKIFSTSQRQLLLSITHLLPSLFSLFLSVENS